MKNPSTRTTVIALAIGLAGIAAGFGLSTVGADVSPTAVALATTRAPQAPTATAAASSASPSTTAREGQSSSSRIPVADDPAQPTGSGGRGATKPPSRTNQAARCSGQGLTAGLRIGTQKAGRQSAVLTMRNKTAQPCTLSGFPDLQLLGHGYDPISTLVVHKGSATTVRLSPAATAWAPLAWSTQPAADEPTGGCQPAASRVAVFAPSDHTQIDLDYSAGPICAHGRIEASAFLAGVPSA